jgi:hypothetical protein
MSRLFGVTHSRLPSWHSLQPAFSAVGWMLASVDDVLVIVNCCKMLEIVLPGTADDTIATQVVSFLRYGFELRGFALLPNSYTSLHAHTVQHSRDNITLVKAALDLIKAVALFGDADCIKVWFV